MNKQYSALARLYDDLMYDVPYEEWSRYIIELLIGENAGPGAEVLEYACGTGNLTLPLARAGYHITAVDASEEMLFCAQEKTRRNALQVNYACGDMCCFRLNKPARAAVCACDGVNYLLTEAELQRFFEQAYANLQARGVFLFDISSAYKLRHILGNEFYYDDGEDETCFWQNRFNEKSKTVRMELTIFIRRDGASYERQDETHVQRAWERAEIERMLRDAGFAEVTAYGFLSGNEPERKEERIQFCAVKKETNDE
ncbi:class I SAM-dependent DNA methyltransferase [Christensenella intestinihominis]|uniref:class I SAM-dependent DNA methyltransferase n=1 Tax=Christensenella intestinihominis TaxID=1851429 RepID=UPI0009F37FA6|nr:class I SAM-dependent methyltransferase [Christensenella intestinihominis]